ncbi:phosphotransferase enzyme family protein [Catenulispora pinisilvae]|uniref:phosphotransferase enzyme family protein n=1 Tax=Catenulispora pinisilvae TaxID=2705253 RepID=UPI002B277641|nr:phosphotransferase [Catenulispora pinisilvae]
MTDVGGTGETGSASEAAELSETGTVSETGEDDLVFGMGSETVVQRDWPSLTSVEVQAVLGEEISEIEWRSPRPLSTTARIRTAAGRHLIVKRLPSALRTPEALAEEHGFMDHVRERGIPVPDAWTAGTRGDFGYEVQELGVGADLYQNVFSWSPYKPGHPGYAGTTLARLHIAAEGYAAPPRPWRPLKSGFSLFGAADPIAAIEQITARRPRLADFLAARDWRSDVERLLLPFHRRLNNDLDPLWTHNDWHGTNLLWSGDHHQPAITAVLDFGLSDRTTAAYDLAIAIERFAVDWVGLRDGVPAPASKRQLQQFLAAYTANRPLSAAESAALPNLFPLCHAEYELSEIDYFLSVLPGGSEKNAEIAYRDWFLGHAEYAKSEEGQAFLGLLGGDTPV